MMIITNYNEQWHTRLATVQLSNGNTYTISIDEANQWLEMLGLQASDDLTGLELTPQQEEYITKPRTYYKVSDAYNLPDDDYYTLVVEPISIEETRALTYIGSYELKLSNGKEVELHPIADAEFARQISREQTTFCTLPKKMLPLNFDVSALKKTFFKNEI